MSKNFQAPGKVVKWKCVLPNRAVMILQECTAYLAREAAVRIANKISGQNISPQSIRVSLYEE